MKIQRSSAERIIRLLNRGNKNCTDGTEQSSGQDELNKIITH